MAGKIKLDGTQFLEKVNNEFKITNSELKLKSTGNTIVDSSGNAVVSESGGNVTLGNVRLPSTGGIKDSSGNNVLSESGGVVTLANDIIDGNSSYGFCRLGLSSTQTTPGDITFNDPVGDTTNFTRSGVNITLGLSGIYFILFSASYVSSDPERAVEALIMLSNGTALSTALDQVAYLESTSSYANATCSYVGHFNANDAIKFGFDSFQNDTADIVTATHANIVLLRRTA